MNARLFSLILVLPAVAAAQSKGLPDGYWYIPKSEPILEKTETIRLAPDLSTLSAGEQQAVSDLLKAGAIIQELYELSLHHQALGSHRALLEWNEKLSGSKATVNLLELYRLNHGPIATTLDNKREPFLPVDPPTPGKNVYPWGIGKEEIDLYLAAHPEHRAEILAERTVVRRATEENLKADLAALERHPDLQTLHRGVQRRLADLQKSPDARILYAVPYSIAYADRMHELHRLLNHAADSAASSDEEFAGYLRNRARDFLTNDYESGDAAWVTGRFNRLNAQIGAYETYDDALYGAKAFHALSILLRNEKATAELRKALGSLQEIEDALPYEHRKEVRSDIPVGVYEVVADFGQARGTNTATILPNDPLYARRYGRTILLRQNIMRHPEIFAGQLERWKSAVSDSFHDDLDQEGNFYRTLWHEIGHYLGVDRDRQGRTLDLALADYADSIEEMKADLVSLFALDILAGKGLMARSELRSIQASGILRTLQTNEPRKDQPYQRMQLVQFNYFLENGLLTFDPATTSLSIRYEKYPAVVKGLLETVLALQYEGDSDVAAGFYRRYTDWRPDLHEALAARIRQAAGPRFRIVRYAAMGE